MKLGKELGLGKTRFISVCIGVLLILILGFSTQELRALSTSHKQFPRTFGKLRSYTPKRGESLFSVARRFNISLRSLSRANPKGTKPLLLPALFFPPAGKPNSISFNLAERVLYLYDATGQPTKIYPAAIGRVGWETPTGQWKIIRKTKNPTWYPPEWADIDEPVPPGPDNPLGDRWIGLSVPGYGIHATNAPASIGWAASHGCIRLYPEHARDLYERVKKGMPVHIIYETILYGYSPEEATVYIAIHPDIYKKGTNSPKRARKMLDFAGLSELLDDKTLGKMLKETSGMPTPVLGSPIKLVVNGAVVPLQYGPTPRGNDFLVALMPLLSALDIRISPGQQNDIYILQQDQKTAILSMCPKTTAGSSKVTRMIAGVRLYGWGEENLMRSSMAFVPLHAICEAFGFTYRYNSATKTIYVDAPLLTPRITPGTGNPLTRLLPAMASFPLPLHGN